jgi:hypothetical protein
MVRPILIAAAIVLALAAPAYAKAPQPAPVSTCGKTGSALADYHIAEITLKTDILVTRGNLDVFARNTAMYKKFASDVDAALAGCRKGEILEIPTLAQYQVTARCDFNKAILKDGNSLPVSRSDGALEF